MAPTEPTSVQIPEPQRRDVSAPLRVIVYIVAGLAVCIAAWALIEGGERDLWSRSSTAALVVASRVPTW